MSRDVTEVQRIVQGRPVTDGAGVKLNRIIGMPELSYIDPFVLLDEFRSNDPEDYRAGFPWHPHRGIETITYMIEGRFEHGDSKGGGGMLTPGDVQWMTAGRGIVHQEMPAMQRGQLWGYQLWLTLPRKDKMVPPRYQHLAREKMSKVSNAGSSVTIIAGRYGDTDGPAQTWFPIEYFDVRLDPGAEFRHPTAGTANRIIYLHSGTARVAGTAGHRRAEQSDLVILGPGTEVEVRAESAGAGFLFLSGKPLNEPIARGGPFVMNTREEIRQAFEDYEKGVLF